MPDVIDVRSAFRDYRVLFTADSVATIAERLDPERTFVVCDEAVRNLFGQYLSPLLNTERLLFISAREESKTVEKSQELIEAMVAANVRRDHTVLAIGGGITQDVTAFAASILYRGIDWAFIPTTLLAQTDSCLGSKTSINVGKKKNLVGNFWPPVFAVIDVRFLSTLSEDEIRSGVGEMVHFYMYADSAMLRPLLHGLRTVLDDRTALRPYIEEALDIKRRVVEIDEFDKTERHKFNFGHTFGHALESTSSYTIPHGLAVMVGMDIANYLSMRMGLMTTPMFEQLHGMLALNFPKRTGNEGDVSQYCQFLARDKKNLGRDVGCILAERPGALVSRQVPFDEDFRQILRDYFCGPWWR